MTFPESLGFLVSALKSLPLMKFALAPVSIFNVTIDALTKSDVVHSSSVTVFTAWPELFIFAGCVLFSSPCEDLFFQLFSCCHYF